MRWVVLILIGWVGVLLQTTFGEVWAIDGLAIGSIAPDLLACVAVFCTLYVGRAANAMIVAWILGLMLDLATAGGPGAAVVGPMAISYCIVARGLFEVREAMFRRRLSTRMLLTLVFCLASHLLWVTVQSILAMGVTGWGEYLRMLGQAVCISIYTALVAPLVFWLLDKVASWLFVAPVGRSGSRRG